MRRIPRKEFEEITEFTEEPITLWEPEYLNEAVIGVSSDSVAIYSYSALINTFMKYESMSEEEARDHIDTNLIGVYLGEKTPIVMDTEFYDYKNPFIFQKNP